MPTIRERLHEIIFEADTRAGRAFDLSLIVLILLSVVVVMLDSVAEINSRHGELLRMAEWGFTILFSIEYVLRLACVRKPLAYATSFFGVVDLLAILPTYLGLVVEGGEFLMVIRLLRVLRVFRILKLAEHFHAGEMILTALRASRIKIGVFLFAVGTVATVIGALMYLVEGPQHGFTSIPRGIYWATSP
jgi:voltage-gated potassium channel